MTEPHVAFAATADAAQRAAGVIAARHRGDFAGAATLLAQADGRDIGDVAGELSLHSAELSPAVGG